MIRLTLKSMRNRSLSILMVTIVGIIALVLVSTSAYIYENSIYCDKTINSVLSEDISNYALVAAMDADVLDELENTTSVSNIINEIPEIKTAGRTEYSIGLEECEFAKIKNKLDKSDEFEYINMSCHAPGLYNIELEEGEFPKDMPYNENENYVYLGSSFKQYYSVGDTSEQKITEDFVIKFTVKGFLKENVRVLDEDQLLSVNPFMGDKCYYELGKTDVLVLHNDAENDNCAICTWEDDYSFDEIREKIIKKTDEYGLNCVVSDVSKIVDEKLVSTREVNSYILNVLGIILITTIVMMICIQVTSILNNMHEYGVMYANGFKTSGIAFMIIFENVLRMIISSILSLLVVYKLLTSQLYNISNTMDVFNDIFINYVVWINLCSAAVICVLSLVIPLIIISKLRPVQLIGGNDT